MVYPEKEINVNPKYIHKNEPFEVMKFVAMIGLILTMIVFAVVVLIYLNQMKVDPCSFCPQCQNIASYINVTSNLG